MLGANCIRGQWIAVDLLRCRVQGLQRCLQPSAPMSSSSQKLSFTVRRPTPPQSRGLCPAAPSENGINFKIPALPRHLSGVSNSSTPLGSPLSQSAASSPRPQVIRERDYDSSDEEDEGLQDELVSGFDRFGVERCVHFMTLARSLDNSQKISTVHITFRADGRKPKAKQAPLIISALKNKDWRAVARKRRGGPLCSRVREGGHRGRWNCWGPWDSRHHQ